MMPSVSADNEDLSSDDINDDNNSVGAQKSYSTSSSHQDDNNDNDNDNPPSQYIHQNNYCSRKPKWWTQLSGRRATRGQRQAIQRMTSRGYCLPKDVLTNFSRVNNRHDNDSNSNSQRNNAVIVNNESGAIQSDDGELSSSCSSSSKEDKADDLISCRLDAWKRAWWNRSLGIIACKGINESNAHEFSDDAASIWIEAMLNKNDDHDVGNHTANKKYSHKIQSMFHHTNPLPHKQYQQIWLEVGFGNGDNLLANASASSENNHPDDVLFMGCEIHQPGVGTVVRQMEMELDNGNTTETSSSSSCFVNGQGQAQVDDGNEESVGINISLEEESNCNESKASSQSTTQFQQSHQPSSLSSTCQDIRILPADGIKLLYILPNNYLDVILVTFPDPWPLDRHARWRVIQREVVREMHRVLKGSSSCGGGRVYVATDAECFDSWAREIFRQESFSSCDDDDDDGDDVGGVGGNNGGVNIDDHSTTSSTTLWREVVPCPDRQTWLPAVSYYEQKGINEGRCTMLQCWQCLGK